MKPLSRTLLILLVIFVGAAMGCTGSQEMPKEELQAKTDLNGIARKAYQQGLTWETLPQADKDAYMALYKDEAKAKESFQKAMDGMKYFFSGGGTPGAGMNPGGK